MFENPLLSKYLPGRYGEGTYRWTLSASQIKQMLSYNIMPTENVYFLFWRLSVQHGDHQ